MMSRILSKITQHTRKPGKWDSFSSKKIINRDQLHDDSDVERTDKDYKAGFVTVLQEVK